MEKLFLESFSLDEVEEGVNSQSESQTTGPLFEPSVNEYVFRETVNIKENLKVPRVFIQSKFIRNSNMLK